MTYKTFDGITVSDGPRDVIGLAAFLSMKVKMPIDKLGQYSES